MSASAKSALKRPIRSVRVAAIVAAPAESVHAAVAKLPAGVTSYVVETRAGVLVTLERPRRWPRYSRRRVIRGLQRELAALRDRAE
jgi:hypothetical protein